MRDKVRDQLRKCIALSIMDAPPRDSTNLLDARQLPFAKPLGIVEADDRLRSSPDFQYDLLVVHLISHFASKIIRSPICVRRLL